MIFCRDCNTYTEKLECYFEVNDIDGSQEKAILLSICVTEIFSLLNDRIIHNNLKDESYETIANAKGTLQSSGVLQEWNVL